MLEMAEAQITACERNPALVRHQLQPERPPDGMLETLLQQEKIRRAKTIVTIAAQRERAIDVLPAKRLLKIKRHGARSRIDGLGKEQSHPHRAVQVPRAWDLGTFFSSRRARIRTNSRCALNSRLATSIQGV